MVTSRLLLRAFAGATLACAIVCEVHAQPADSVGRVVFVGNLDFDGTMDTVLAIKRPNSGYLPKSVRWGTATGNQQRTTRFHFPSWENLQGSTSFVRLNQDTLTDIVLFLWGRIPGSQPARDTVRSLVIFAQPRLKEVNQVNVHQIAAPQSSPFFAQDLVEGTHLLDGRSRDYTDRPSWVLGRVQLDVTDTSEAPLPGRITTTSNRGIATVSPNPASTSTLLGLDGFAPGEYKLQFVATNGTVVKSVLLRVGDSRVLRQPMDLASIPSGSYELQIVDSEGIVVTLRLVIAH